MHGTRLLQKDQKMKITSNNPIWQQIYPNLRDTFYKNTKNPWVTVIDLEKWLSEEGIQVIHDPYRSNGRLWEAIILPDGDEFIELMIKWS